MVVRRSRIVFGIAHVSDRVRNSGYPTQWNSIRYSPGELWSAMVVVRHSRIQFSIDDANRKAQWWLSDTVEFHLVQTMRVMECAMVVIRYSGIQLSTDNASHRAQ